MSVSRMSGHEITALLAGFCLTRDRECDCRGPLDTCLYCATVRGQEALERLVALDPFVEAPQREVGSLAEGLASVDEPQS